MDYLRELGAVDGSEPRPRRKDQLPFECLERLERLLGVDSPFFSTIVLSKKLAHMGEALHVRPPDLLVVLSVFRPAHAQTRAHTVYYINIDMQHWQHCFFQLRYVLMPNYMLGPSNCDGTTSFYDLCCPSTCEVHKGHLERAVMSATDHLSAISSVVQERLGAEVPAPMQQQLQELSKDSLRRAAVCSSGTCRNMSTSFSEPAVIPTTWAMPHHFWTSGEPKTERNNAMGHLKETIRLLYQAPHDTWPVCRMEVRS